MTRLMQLETNEEFEMMKEGIRKIQNLKELNEEIFNEIQEYEENGFYSPLSEEAFHTVPFSERWYVKYEPTYHMSVLLLKYYMNGHFEVYDQLVQTIYACLSKNYMGHSYDAHYVRVNILTQLYENGLNELLKYERDLKVKFESMVYEYRVRLTNGNTAEGFGNLKEDIMELLKVVDTNILFVYGTLMEGEVNCSYLSKCEKLGNAFINGYELVDLEYYPGMIQGNNIVAGECYRIDKKVKEKLDRLEGSQYIYTSDFVTMNGLLYYAHFYQYKINNQEYKTCLCNHYRWIDKTKYVWYACYGSNLLDARFNEYIMSTTSKQAPIVSKPIILKYQLYFAKNSRKWNYEGVAFLDIHSPGNTLGYKYLITKEQFDEIQRIEGAWYSNKVLINTDEHGIDTYTFTSPTKYEEVKPSEKYLNVIKKGLKEKYSLEDDQINNYLNNK